MPATLEAFMAKDKELKDLFLDTLKDIYFAEKKILSALPKMAKARNLSHMRMRQGGGLGNWRRVRNRAR